MLHDLTTLVTEAALLGAATGLHCAAMCGPLAACAVRPGSPTREVASVAAGYHLARASGYALAGALAGALGSGASGALGGPLGAGVPWAMALLLGLQAAGALPKLGSIPWLGPRVNRAAARASFWKPGARAAALGALTPLLPCGPRFAVYGLAIGAGSALHGAAMLAAFALGSVPLLLATQIGWGSLQRSSLARFAAPAQRLMLLAAALTLAWRGWALASGADCCPSP